MKSPRILVTGFRPYSRYKFNSSEELVKEVDIHKESIEKDLSVHIQTLTLEASYRRCEIEFLKKLKEVEPDIVISFGMSPRSRKVRIERIALNIDDSRTPDVDGVIKRGERIVKDGPAAYWATLPVETLYKELLKEKIPATISNYPGTYVCNHLFYYGLHAIKELKLKTKMGFIHIPKLKNNFSNAKFLLKLGKICIRVCRNNVKDYEHE